MLRQVEMSWIRFPEHDREILEMRHIDGMTLHDAALHWNSILKQSRSVTNELSHGSAN